MDDITKTAIIALGGFVLGVIVVLFIMKMAAPGMMIHEVKSPYDFNTTVDTIIANAKSEGWTVPKTYNFQKSILDAGAGDVGRTEVIEMCQPEYASGLLGADDTKFVAVMMPCAVAVYEKSDGGTYVASMNVGIMGKVFGGAVDQTMSKVAADDKKILGFAQVI
ncbi:DUF302 domain-containing protein [Methanosarcinales archaeon]|nr:MAG: DUF302 domain-containing protein [Methanosarcinales archaeon]